MNSFERIMSRLADAENGVTEKTAEVKEASEDKAAKMLAKVREISASSAKTAAAPVTSPVEDLQKIAESAAKLENDALVKEAQFLGAAIADGFMARFAAYDTALTSQGVKTASTPSVDLEKLAQDAYAQGQADLEKQAAESYNQGYQEQMSEVAKTAAVIHLAGQNTAREIVEHNAKNA